MSRLPNVGGDDNSWGTILNDYLSVSHNSDGTINTAALPTSSSSTAGIVQLATTTEATTGTNTTKAVTPAGLKAVGDTKVIADGITTVKLVTVAPDPASQVAGTLYVVQGTTTAWAATPASTTVAGVVQLATPAQAITGTDTTKAVTPAALDAALIVGAGPITLTDATTIATDASLGNYFRVSITANRTLGTPTNPTDGQKAIWEVTASGGARVLTLTVGSTGAFKFGTDFTTIPSIASGTATFIGAVYRSATSRWHVLSLAQGH
jgi:hypothetical protein